MIVDNDPRKKPANKLMIENQSQLRPATLAQQNLFSTQNQEAAPSQNLELSRPVNNDKEEQLRMLARLFMPQMGRR